jgi:hypothetical protein
MSLSAGLLFAPQINHGNCYSQGMQEHLLGSGGQELVYLTLLYFIVSVTTHSSELA